MCGICGILYSDPLRHVTEQLLTRMNDTIRHRGPDDDGIYTDGQAGIAMRRLSIIDVSGGHQPISNEDGTVWIVYNGETYNYQGLREELIHLGHVFKTHSDTETILHAYEEFGNACVERLNGMFCFAIWDSRNRSLFIARDRLGIKPLYFDYNTERLVFGSEIKPLLASDEIDTSIDLKGFQYYLTYLYTPAARTIYKNVQKLLPGHTLTWRDGQITVEKYWDVSYTEDTSITEPDALEQLDELLTDAVGIRLMSEVPLGAFLSGGIDSSMVVAYMMKALDRPVETFSIGFPGEGPFNELNDARVAAAHLKTEHHELVVEPDAVGLMPDIMKYLDEPMGDSSVVPTYLLSQFARDHVTVSLAGDGGDELFAGYDRYKPAQAALMYDRLPELLRKGLIRPVLGLIPEVEQKDGMIARLRRIGGDLDRGYRSTFLRWITNFNQTTMGRLCTPELLEIFGELDAYDVANRYLDQDGSSTAPLNQLLRFETKAYLPDDLLMKVDRMSMAHSLEVRVPLIDYRLVEFAASLPVHMKLKGFNTKYLLKKLSERYLPDSIVNKKKQGFVPPLSDWLRGPLGDYARDVLLDQTARNRGFFKADEVSNMLDDHQSGRRSFHYQIWVLLAFEMWCRSYLDDTATLSS
ncbi:MAG: asparagine synthase (glutamine-hydrolyzing) [Candidatus Latescibacteria bacterium]|nr:asparagine synthase (glutamine-hydrolyzing) [Candidatus Latescibacterota bacterium]